VISADNYSQHLQSLLIQALANSPIAIDTSALPAAVLYISNQGIIRSGQFAIGGPQAAAINRQQRQILKRSAMSLSPVAVTQAMQNKPGVYAIKVALK
jgi:hypothetical protein